jgi:SRSO17 transposase
MIRCCVDNRRSGRDRRPQRRGSARPLVEHLGDPQAVLVVDETGDFKKGTCTVGCSASTPAPRARSTTPRSPSTWSTPPPPGAGVIDRELYLPQRWLDDPARCHAADVPDQRTFATKPELAG